MRVSFESYRKHRRNMLMERREYVPLRRFDDAPQRSRWVFHLRLV